MIVMILNIVIFIANKDKHLKQVLFEHDLNCACIMYTGIGPIYMMDLKMLICWTYINNVCFSFAADN